MQSAELVAHLQALQSSRCEAVSAGDNFLDDMQSQGQAHALELISSEGIGSPTLALMSEALPASKLGQEALQEGLPVSLLTGDLNIAQLPLLSQSSEVSPGVKQQSILHAAILLR